MYSSCINGKHLALIGCCRSVEADCNKVDACTRCKPPQSSMKCAAFRALESRDQQRNRYRGQLGMIIYIYIYI